MIAKDEVMQWVQHRSLGDNLEQFPVATSECISAKLLIMSQMVLAGRLTSWFSPSLKLKLKDFSSVMGTSLTGLGRSFGEEQTAATACLCSPQPPFSHLNFAIDKLMENQVH